LTPTLADTHHHPAVALECWRGTSPSQATRCLPFLKSEPSPIAATIAVAVFGPIPRIFAILWQTSLALKSNWAKFTAQRLNPHRSLVPTWAIWIGYPLRRADHCT